MADGISKAVERDRATGAAPPGLTVLEHVPEGLLDAPADALYQILPGPTLMHVRGRREPPLFVCTLLHGNEDTGLQAVQRLLQRYRARELPRALSLFLGNVAAARYGLRRLEGQPDYNRVWPGSETEGTAEHAVMAQVVAAMRRRGVFASIDLHNTSGLNPQYACVNRLEPRFLNLARLFGRTVVYFTRPRGVQSMAFASLCPSTTVECGKVGNARGLERAREFLETAINLDVLPDQPPAERDLQLFHTVAVVKIPPAVPFTLGEGPAPVRFVPDLDTFNFRELPAGTVLARVDPGSGISLDVRDEQGHDVAARYFEIRGGALRTRRTVMPSMLTDDASIIRQDCLCYLMERYALPRAGATGG